LRHWVREQMYARASGAQVRIMARWLRARNAEGKEGPVTPPSIQVDERQVPTPRCIPRRPTK